MHILRAVEFEWDDAKDARNIRAHGVAFDEAATTFYDPLALLRADDAHPDREVRFLLLDTSGEGRLLVTVFTECGDRMRIISSRCATRREARDYEEGI